MRTKNINFNAPIPSASLKLIFNVCLVACLTLGTVGAAFAGAIEQARRMHDRLTGVPPTDVVLQAMAAEITKGTLADYKEAAKIAMIPNYLGVDNAKSVEAFYSVSLKNFATPWTNVEQTVHAPLNDYTATVIGMIRDDVPFDQVLYGDIVYVGAGSGISAYSDSDNANYEDLENNHKDLSSSANLQQKTQTEMNMAGATQGKSAGVNTTRAAGMAFIEGGTNRRLFAYTTLNHLCRNIETLKDNTRVPDRIRQDVSRSPGGDSSIFLNHCVACHAGMDPLIQSFAYFEWIDDGNPDDTVNSGHLEYKADMTAFAGNLPDKPIHKYLINSGNFEWGYVTPNDNWNNYWRAGPNASLNWDFNPTLSPGGSGTGPKEFGKEIAATEAFAQCQVEKVYKFVCLQDPTASVMQQIKDITTAFAPNYNMKEVFASVAPMCMGQ